MRQFLRLASSAALVGAAFGQGAPAPSLLLINEIRIDQSGADNDEYFELFGGPPNATLDGLTYLVIGDGAAGSGVIEAVVPLTGSSINGSGLFLAAEATFSLGTADLTANLNFENGDNVTHLIVRDFTGADGDDLDVDDDGVLDVTPWANVMDAISLVQNPMGGDFFYGSALGGVDVGPDGTFVPGHVYRCLTSITDVRIGVFDIPTGLDTPGAFNAPCVVTQSAFCNPSGPNSFSMGGGHMGRTGTGSISVNDNALTCSDVPNFFGVFVQADGAGTPNVSPIGGQFCVNSNIVRMNSIVVPASNVATLALDFTDPLLVEFGTLAGVTTYYQYFHRDTLFMGGGNWSNGIAITWAP
ncbi:MAG: hypothetical protein R3F49_22145 [Planctomycetota bacterium]